MKWLFQIKERRLSSTYHLIIHPVDGIDLETAFKVSLYYLRYRVGSVLNFPLSVYAGIYDIPKGKTKCYRLKAVIDNFVGICPDLCKFSRAINLPVIECEKKVFPSKVLLLEMKLLRGFYVVKDYQPFCSNTGSMVLAYPKRRTVRKFRKTAIEMCEIVGPKLDDIKNASCKNLLQVISHAKEKYLGGGNSGNSQGLHSNIED